MQPSRTTIDKSRLTRRPKDGPIRVMIVDDSLTVRTVFSRMVAGDGAMEIVGTASNAERAISLLRTTPIDVMLLDLEMPGMGGLEALPKILELAEHAQVLVVSSLTDDGAEHTLAALSMGAADTMLKPRPGGFDDEYRSSLLGKIKALGGLGSEVGAGTGRRTTAPLHSSGKRPKVVAVGASTGGIHALNLLLRALPKEFDLPILVTQHLPDSFMPVFARQIEIASARRTLIADHGTPIDRGQIVIASGQSHMVVSARGDRLETRISQMPASSGCLPSVDPMLESLAAACDGHALAVILSGMGADGCEGARALVDKGGSVIAQDAESSAVWGMPGAVSKAGLASAILPPEQLAKKIVERAGVSAWK